MITNGKQGNNIQVILFDSSKHASNHRHTALNDDSLFQRHDENMTDPLERVSRPFTSSCRAAPSNSCWLYTRCRVQTGLRNTQGQVQGSDRKKSVWTLVRNENEVRGRLCLLLVCTTRADDIKVISCTTSFYNAYYFRPSCQSSQLDNDEETFIVSIKYLTVFFIQVGADSMLHNNY